MGSSSDERRVNNRLRALLVDDDKIARTIHTKQLNRLGIDVMEAENGKKAVEMCGSGEFFDLILMDHDMPVMDGSAATRSLREMGVTSVIVGVSSLSSEMEKQAFKDAGLDDFLEKPLTSAKLNSVVEKMDKDNH